MARRRFSASSGVEQRRAARSESRVEVKIVYKAAGQLVQSAHAVGSSSQLVFSHSLFIMNFLSVLLLAVVSGESSRDLDSTIIACRCRSACLRSLTRKAAVIRIKASWVFMISSNLDLHADAFQKLLAQVAAQNAKQQQQGIVAVTGSGPSAVQTKRPAVAAASRNAAVKQRRSKKREARAAQLVRVAARALAAV